MRFLNASLKFKTSYFLSLTVFILILSTYTPTVYSAQIALSWDQNTEQDLSGYKIYYGTSSDNYTFSIDVGKITNYTLSSLESGKTYYVSVTAYDTEGYESDFSDEVSFATPPECTYSISPVSQSLEAPGGAGAINVTTQSGCGWTAISNASWLVITSNSSNTGNGVVNYSVLANTGGSSRTGTLTIAGQTFTVTQSGVSQYSLTITKSGTGSGTVTTNPSGTSFNAGTVVTLTETPDVNSTFAGWSGGYTGSSPTCTVTMNSDLSMTATFTLKTYTITASAGANGSISPSGTVTVNHGANQTFTISPNSGYGIADVKVDSGSVGKVSSYTLSNVTGNHSIEASFNANTPNSYTLTITKSGTGSGSVSSNLSGTSFNAGTVVTLTATPDSNSTFSGWWGGGSGTSPTYTVTMNSDVTVTAAFALKYYTITAQSNANGSISPYGTVTVNYGASQTFTITPNIGYSIGDVKVDGSSVGQVSSYTFSNVTGNHSIKVIFKKVNKELNRWR